MKLCPQCNTGFPDAASTCPTHGGMLNEIRELKPGMVIRKTYRIVRKLGKGGMGIVYLADHLLMREQRALKFLSADLCEDATFADRFRREVQSLRQVRHKNVVDCGDLEPAEDDSLFFPMEYVDGPSLRQLLHRSKGPLDVTLALQIARSVADGLGAAHALGMVHRDVKPENILLSPAGDGWTPKIADFGIVACKENLGNRTRTGGTLLTMPYAAPEQWSGMRAAELDGRTDLYALGGVLYEMLTERTAFEADSYEGWAKQHLHVAPRAPSELRPGLANWKGLDQLVLRLLAKDRQDRPKDVAEVLRLLDEVATVSPEQRSATVVEDKLAVPEETLVVSEGKFMISGNKTSLVEDKTVAQTRVQKKTHSRKLLWGAIATLFVASVVAGWLVWPLLRYHVALEHTLQGDSGLLWSVAFSPDGRTLASAGDDKTIKLWEVSSGRLLHTLRGHTDAVMSVAFNPEGDTLASGSIDNTIKLWDVSDGQLLRTLHGQSKCVASVVFSPDGRTMASGGCDYTIKLWDVSSGQLLRTLQGHSGVVNSVAFSPDGRTLASASDDKTVKLWDVSSGQLLHTLHGHGGPVRSVAFSPDAHALASGSDDDTIKFWDVSSGQLLRTLQADGEQVFSVAFSPDGRTLASGNSESIKLWDVSGGRLLSTLQSHSGSSVSVAFSPDGRTLASGNGDHTITLWDVSHLP